MISLIKLRNKIGYENKCVLGAGWGVGGAAQVYEVVFPPLNLIYFPFSI